MLSHSDIEPTLDHGYVGELDMPGTAIESDASKDIVHLDWKLPAGREHHVVACCVREGMALPEVKSESETADKAVIELQLPQQVVSIPAIS